MLLAPVRVYGHSLLITVFQAQVKNMITYRHRLSDRLSARGLALLLLMSLGLLACSEPASTTPSQAVAGMEPVTSPPRIADLSGLNPGWNVFEPGGAAICSDGSPYRFFVRPGEPEKLMFYLEGGGACWDGATCDPDLRPSYQVNLVNTDPSRAHGVLAFEQPGNPFVDYTVVYAPYCSGDVHLGDAEQHYQGPSLNGQEGRTVHIRHRGLANAQTALDWTFSHVFNPAQVFVTGSSAGSIPSPFYAVTLADQYPEASVVQLGDASGGYRGFANFSPYDTWHTDRVVSSLPYVRDIPADQFSFHHLYIGASQINSRIRYASYDNAEDDVQKQFLALGGTPSAELKPLLETNLAEISQANPDFRYYVAGGTMHTILLRPEVYSYEVNGTRFLDWLTALAAGQPVNNVMCSECAEYTVASAGATAD